MGVEQLVVFGCGVIGFTLYECIRIYHCHIKNLKALPEHERVLFVFVVAALAVMSGLLALLVSEGSNTAALIVGMAVPLGVDKIKGILNSGVGPDDIYGSGEYTKLSTPVRIKFTLDCYFARL